MNEYTDIVNEQKQEELRSSLYAGARQQPDTEAKVQALAARVGLPVDAVRRNQPELELHDRLQSFDYEKVLRESPKLSAWLADPNNAAIAHDDWESLSRTEKLLTHGRDYAGAVGQGVIGQGAGTTLSGFGELNRAAGGAIGNVIIEGAGLFGDRAKQATRDFLTAPVVPWWLSPTGILKAPGEQLKAAGEIMAPPKERQTLGTDVASGIGQLGFQIGAYLLTGGASSTSMMFAQGADIMAEKTEGDIADPAMRDTAILAGGTITALTERYGLDKILNRVPPAVKNRTLRFIADKVAAGGIEAGQEFTEGLLHDITRRLTTNEDAEILQGVEREMSAAALSAAIVRTALGVKGYRQAQQNEQFFKALGEDATNSKLRERLPDRFRDLVAKYTENGPVQQVLVPADRFAEYFQSVGMDPAAVAQEAGAQNFVEALAGGSDVVIPMADFVAKIAPSDHLQGLMQDLRLAPDEMTMRELADFEANREENDKALQEELTAINEAAQSAGSLDAAIQRIVTDVEGQLRGRYDAQTAKQMATVMRGVAVLAQRASPDANPLEAAQALWDRYGLTIRANPLPKVLTERRDYDVNIDPMLDRLRRGEIPSEAEQFGPSLTEWLRERGGVRDDGGELRGMDADKELKPFQKRLVREDGQELDMAREAAAEAGYLPADSTVADFLELIDEDVRGRAKYSMRNENPQAVELARGLEELGRYLDEIGVNLSEMDNAAVKALLREMEGGREFEQARRVDFDSFVKKYVESRPVDKFGYQQKLDGLIKEIEGDWRSGSSDDYSGRFGPDEIYATLLAENEAEYFDADGDLTDAGNARYNKVERELSERIARERLGEPEQEEVDFSDPATAADILHDYFESAGLNPNAVGGSGLSRSKYFVLGDGRNVRISDHELPDHYVNDSDFDVILPADSEKSLGVLRDSAADIIGAVGNRGTFDPNDPNILYQSAVSEPDRQFKLADLPRDMREELFNEHATNMNPEATERAFYAKRVPSGLIDIRDIVVDEIPADQLQRYLDARLADLPPIVIADGRLIDGQHRIQAARERGIRQLRYIDVTGLIDTEAGGYVSELPRELNQDRRGSIQISPDRSMRINLFEKADLSTFLHETGHFYLEVMGDLAEDANASEQVRDDYVRILKFLGVKNRSEIEVKHHEKWARANEAYLMEGKAPAPELRGVFQRFSAWLKLIYRQLTALNVELTDEVRGVMDRIYATDAEIERAKADSGLKDLFIDAETAGMTDAEFALYRDAIAEQTVEAKDELQQKLMRVEKLKREKWWKDEKAKVAEEVAAEYDAQPAAQALARMVEPNSGERLNKKQLVDRYGDGILKRLPRSKNTVYAVDGNDLDLAAEVMGFRSGDELVEALAGLPNRARWIAAETDARMMERHGDLLNSVALADEASAALHNQAREKVLRIELRALRKKAREVKPFQKAERDAQRQARMAATDLPPVQAFRDMARGMIGQKQIRDITPNTYLLAERKASRAAFTAMAKGDTVEASLQKQRELLNHYMYLEARNAVERADKIAKYAEGLNDRKAQERVGKGGEEYLAAMNELLDAYQFRRTTKKQLDLIQKVRAAVAVAEANGEVIDVLTDEQGNVIDPVLLRATNYRELTLDELEAVRDMLKNIEHIAREGRKFRAAEVQATFDEIAGKALDEIADGKPVKDIQVWKLRDPRQQKMRAIPLAITEWRGLFSYIQEAVGFKQNSTLWNYVMRPLNEAAAREAVMKRDAALKLDALFKRYSTTYLYGKGRVIPGVGPVNKQQQLMIAASYGTETGRQRMLDNGLDGRGMTQPQIDAVLDSLDAQDWQFVQELWALFDSYWGDIAEKQQRVSGVRPQSVERLPFETRFGTMPGGYSPIAYESFLDNRAAAQQAAQIADEMKRSAYTRNTTRRGFLKERVQKVQGKAVRYDFGVIYKHLNEVIHDVTHHETLRDVQKLLNHKLDGRSILDEITQRMGYGVRDQIVDVLEEVAVGDLRIMGSSERIMEHLAAGASIAGLAYNVWNAVQNLTGIFNSMAVSGPGAVLRGAWEWTGTPQHMLDTVDAVNQKSEFMRTRYLNMNRDINAMRGKLEQSSGRPVVDDAYAAFRDAGFWMMIRVQQMVDMPTWLGAYDQAKRTEPGISEANAVALADQAVIAAQGGGRTVDLSKFMRGKGWARVWTVFAGYFNVGYQRTVESMKRAKAEDYSPAAVGRTVADMFFLMVAPAAMTLIMKQVIDAMVGGDDDDGEEWARKYFQEQISYILAMFPFLRETTAAVAGYANYSGPVGARFFADVNKFIQQVAQGEVDENLVKSGVRVAGTPLGIPTGQIIKTYDGMEEMIDGEATPVALVFGPPKKE